MTTPDQGALIEGTMVERQKRAEHLHDLLLAARESARRRLSPQSEAEDRGFYEMLDAALYSLRSDPFDMHMRAALSAQAPAARADGPGWREGDRVEKYTGDYQLVGEVRAAFTTKAGKVRYVVEHEPGFLHIYGPDNLRAVSPAAPSSEETRAVAAKEQVKRLIEVLEQLVAEKCDYMLINSLGDPEKQHTIKAARAALVQPQNTGGRDG